MLNRPVNFLTLTFLLVITVPHRGLTQQGAPRPEAPAGGPAPARRAQADRGVEREIILSRLRDLVQHVRSFREIEPKVRALTAFGELMWDKDQAYARNLFIEALDALHSIKVRGDGDRSRAWEENEITSARAAMLRGVVMIALARRDPALARKLSEEKLGPDSPLTDARSALSILGHGGDSASAIEFAKRGLRGEVSEWAFHVTVFLRALRRSGKEAEADELFLQVTKRLRSYPEVSVHDLLTVGTYLFTHSGAERFRGRDDGLGYVQINDLLVVDITVDRPGIKPPTVQAYLGAAIDLLARNAPLTGEKQKYYVALRMLLQKANRFDPPLTAPILATLQTLSADVPPSLKEDALPVKTSVRDAGDLSDELSDIDAIPDEKSRDEKLLLLIHRLYAGDQPASALGVAERVRDHSARAKLLTLLKFKVALGLIKAGKIAPAEQEAAKLEAGVERAILLLKIARAQHSKGRTAQASESVNAGLKDVRRLDKDGRQPYLLLEVADQLLRSDALTTGVLLREAVEAFNSSDGKAVEWPQRVEVGRVSRRFSLLPEGELDDLAPVVKRLYVADDATLSAVLLLKAERLRAQGLVSIFEVLAGRA